MAPELAAVIERLLEEVALCGNYGFEAAKLRVVVNTIYDDFNKQVTARASSHDQDQASPAEFQANVDNQLISEIWLRLKSQPDLEFQEGERLGSDLSKDGEYTSSRMVASPERIWQALAGHGVDKKRIPNKEFDLLSVIGAHGSAGILQPEATRLLGHDKHSTPRRTDMLAEKGYITKKSVVTGRQMTSLLTLKKFEPATGGNQEAKAVSRDPQEGVVFNYDVLFDKVVELVKEQPNNLLAVDDLRLSLDIPHHERDIQALFSCVRRLARCKCFRTLRAASSHGPVKGRTAQIPCIQLVEEPTAEDKELCKIWSTGKMYVDRRPIYLSQGALDDPPEEPDNEADDRVNGHTLTDPLTLSTIDTSAPNLIFRIVERSGQNGVSLEELHAQATPHASKAVDYVLHKLTDDPQSLQPMHLGHLAIVRARKADDPDAQPRLFTVLNFNAAVKSGKAVRENASADQDGVRAITENPQIPLDRWGFPTPDATLFGQPERSPTPHMTDRIPFPVADEATAISASPVRSCSGQPIISSPAVASAAIDAPSFLRPKRPSHRKDSSLVDESEAAATLDSPRTRQLETRERRSTTTLPTPAEHPPGFRAPKKVIRRMTSEKDQPEFERWAKKTAENMVRAQILAANRDDDYVNEPTPKKRKLNTSEASPAQSVSFSEAHVIQIADIEADLLDRERPGIYINPPGARDMKAQFYIQRGRPRNAAIAAIKTERLRSLPWFTEEQKARDAPLASRRRTKFFLDSRAPRKDGQQKESNSGSTEDQDQVVEKKSTIAPDAATLSDTLDTTAPVSVSCAAPDTAMSHATNDRPNSTALPPAEDNINTSSPPAATLATHKQDMSAETFDKEYVLAHKGIAFHHVGNGRYRRGPKPAKVQNCNDDPIDPALTRPRPLTESTITPQEQPTARSGKRKPAASDAAQPAMNNSPAPTFSRTYVDAHPKETFRHVGGGWWRRVITEPSAEEHATVDMAPPTSSAPQDAVTPDVTFDKDYVLTRGDEDFHHVGNGRWRWGPKPARPANTPASPTKTLSVPPSTTQIRLHSDIGRASGRSDTVRPPLKIPSHGDKESPTEQTLPRPPELPSPAHAVVAPSTPETRSEIEVAQRTSPARCRSTPAAGLGHVTSASAQTLGLTQFIDSNPTRQRPKVIMDLLRQHGGVYPGNKELWQPFVTVWQLLYARLPKVKRFDTAVKSLIDSGKLKKITFSFRSPSGMNEERSILALHDIDASSPGVTELKNRIIHAFPQSYLPEKGKVFATSSAPAATGVSQSAAFTPAQRSAEFRRQHKPAVQSSRPFALVEGLTVMRTPQGLQHLKSQRMKDYHKNNKKTLLVTIRVPSAQLELVQTDSERLRLAPGQSFHSPSGTYATNGTIQARQPRRRRKSSTEPSADAELPQRVAKTRKAATPGTGLSALTYDKSYVEQHPTKSFHHVGRGRWRWEEPAAAHDSLYDKLYAQAHPDDGFYQLGNGRFRRGQDPTTPTVPQPAPAPILPSMLPPSPVSAVSNQQWLSQRANQHLTQYQSPSLSGSVDTPLKWQSPHIVPYSAAHGQARSNSLAAGVNSSSSTYQTRKRRVDYEELNRPTSGLSTTSTSRSSPQPPKKRQKKKAAPDFAHADDLVLALALTKTLCSGLDQKRLPWDLVAHAIEFRYDAETLQSHWTTLAKVRATEVDRLQIAIREPFLAAYENGKLPQVDFQTLSNTDWPALLKWTKQTVLPLPVQTPIAEVSFDLPSTTKGLTGRFHVKERGEDYGPSRNTYFNASYDTVRSDIALAFPQGQTAQSTNQLRPRCEDGLTLLKSWCRAITITPAENYNSEAAAQKISIFPEHLVQKANDELVRDHIFRMEKKDRQLPGRNFYLSRAMLKQFDRWPRGDMVFVKELVAAHTSITTHFAQNDAMHLSYHAKDSEIAVLTNMVARGHLKVISVLPERDDSPDAPFPRFSVWGMDDVKVLYNSHEVDSARLRFPVVYERTPTYTPHHGLKSVPVPTRPHLVLSEPGLRIPLWVDMNGNVVAHLWDMVLRSILHLVVYRPGSTAKTMEKAHEGKMWAWEIEMVLLWMEEVGLAFSFGPGKEEDGVWKGGWRAGEWWYCAFAPDIATWCVPALPT